MNKTTETLKFSLSLLMKDNRRQLQISIAPHLVALVDLRLWGVVKDGKRERQAHGIEAQELLAIHHSREILGDALWTYAEATKRAEHPYCPHAYPSLGGFP